MLFHPQESFVSTPGFLHPLTDPKMSRFVEQTPMTPSSQPPEHGLGGKAKMESLSTAMLPWHVRPQHDTVWGQLGRGKRDAEWAGKNLLTIQGPRTMSWSRHFSSVLLVGNRGS